LHLVTLNPLEVRAIGLVRGMLRDSVHLRIVEGRLTTTAVLLTESSDDGLGSRALGMEGAREAVEGGIALACGDDFRQLEWLPRLVPRRPPRKLPIEVDQRVAAIGVEGLQHDVAWRAVPAICRARDAQNARGLGRLWIAAHGCGQPPQEVVCARLFVRVS